jgi:hypothetical protein
MLRVTVLEIATLPITGLRASAGVDSNKGEAAGESFGANRSERQLPV